MYYSKNLKIYLEIASTTRKLEDSLTDLRSLFNFRKITVFPDNALNTVRHWGEKKPTTFLLEKVQVKSALNEHLTLRNCSSFCLDCNKLWMTYLIHSEPPGNQAGISGQGSIDFREGQEESKWATYCSLSA